MKLELKHIAPYLPYGLEFEINIFDQAMKKGIMVGANSKEIEFSEIRKTITESFTYDLCIPLLRTLSDLTKEIEHNGEKFVPIERIKESQRHLFFRNDIDAPLDGLQFSEIQKLFSWHFDVFGLIEQGLAIDLNTVKN